MEALHHIHLTIFGRSTSAVRTGDGACRYRGGAIVRIGMSDAPAKNAGETNALFARCVR